MKLWNAGRPASLIATILLFGACSDISDVSAPEQLAHGGQLIGGRGALAKFVCAGSTENLEVSCEAAGGGSPFGSTGGPQGAILGGQDLFVTLTSSNIAVTADTFAFDVTVTNRIPQPIGTTDGINVDVAGVRVFFESGPTSTGAGTITVANPDGTGTFTASDQPYFQYNQVLYEDSTSAAKRWKLRFSGVTEFEFEVFVSAAVPFANGYVGDIPFVLSLNPNEEFTLFGKVFDLVGREIEGAMVSWATNNPSIAEVSGKKVTAGPGRGFATLSASSGGRPPQHPTFVSVCQATMLNGDTVLPSSISSSDCFSTFGSEGGTPSNLYYVDLYRVTLSAGQEITVTMDSGDELDTFLQLARHRDGVLVAENDDDPTDVLGVGSRLVYTADETGVYVIEASTFHSLDTGDYELGVTID